MVMEDVFRRMKMRVVVGRTVETTTMIAVLRTISLGTILAASGDFDGTVDCARVSKVCLNHCFALLMQMSFIGCTPLSIVF